MDYEKVVIFICSDNALSVTAMAQDVIYDKPMMRGVRTVVCSGYGLGSIKWNECVCGFSGISV